MSSRSITIIPSHRRSMMMLESRPIADLPRLLEAEEGKEKVKQGLLSKLGASFRDSPLVDAGLDLISAFGVGGEALGAGESATGFGAAIGLPTLTIGAAISIVADLINAVRRALRGEYFDAALYVIFAIPIIGDALQAAKEVGAGTKATMSMLKPVINFMRKHRDDAKKLKTIAASKKLIDLAADKIPGADNHREGMQKALDAIATGDVEKIKNTAKEVGQNALSQEIEDLIKNPPSKSKSPAGEGGKAELSESTLIRIVREETHRMLREGVREDQLDEARKRGKSVVKKGDKKASAGSVATFKKAASKKKGGERKKRHAGFDAVKKSAEKWADNPAAAAQAATMVATGKPVVAKGEKRKVDEALDLYRDLVEGLDPSLRGILVD